MVCCIEAVRDLSCISEIVEKLLTVIFCNNFLQFHGSIWRQFQFGEIASQYSRFVKFMMKTSPVMNPKCLSKSLSANPWFLEEIGTCRNELIWKHCGISICQLNSWVAFDKSKLWQVRWSRDCNLLIKLSSYSSHEISQITWYSHLPSLDKQKPTCHNPFDSKKTDVGRLTLSYEVAAM